MIHGDNMDIIVCTKDDLDIVAIVGRLDSETSSKLEDWANEFIDSPKNNIIMDFNQLDYISSAGLRVIFNMSKVMKKFSYKFSICNAQDHVREVFEISGFTMIFNIEDSCI